MNRVSVNTIPCRDNAHLLMLGVGIAIGIGIESGRLSSKSIPIPNPIPIPITPACWRSYTVSQSERNS